MKAVALAEIKKELNHKTSAELESLCLHLARFKKENKELLTYLLFESHHETEYITSVKHYIDAEFEQINTSSYFYMRKTARKILTNTKKYIRYSKTKETEIELLLHFCKTLKNLKPSIKYSTQLQNMYHRQVLLIRRIQNLDKF